MLTQMKSSLSDLTHSLLNYWLVNIQQIAKSIAQTEKNMKDQNLCGYS